MTLQPPPPRVGSGILPVAPVEIQWLPWRGFGSDLKPSESPPVLEEGGRLARYRQIRCSFWTDPKVIGLEPTSKITFIYLITNPHAHLSGIYTLDPRYGAVDLGVSLPTFQRALGELERAGMVLVDKDRNVLFVVKMLKYQGRGPKIDRAAADQLESLHGSPLIGRFLDEYPTVADYIGIKRGSRDGIPQRTRFRILARDCFTCRYCGSKSPSVELEVDHVKPVASGGSDADDNLVTSCTACNCGKAAIPYFDIVDTPSSQEQEQEQEQEISAPGLSKTQDPTPHPHARRRARGANGRLTYSPGFLTAWAAYPHYGGRSVKAMTFAVWQQRGLEALSGSVAHWIKVYARSPDWRHQDGERVPGMQVWLKRPDFNENPEVAF